MNLKEFIVHWNNTHKYDYWWRQKYNIPFNSPSHRTSNQFDIAFEYFEDKAIQEEIIRREEEQKKKEEFKKTGQWIKEQEEDKEKADRLFNSIKIEDFNG